MQLPVNWNINNDRIDRLFRLVWKRLPTTVKSALQSSDIHIQDTPEWDDFIKEALGQSRINWNCGRFNPDIGIIEISAKECEDIEDMVLIGAFAHEVAHAYQSLITPSDSDAIEKAGDTLPVAWGFSVEIKALDAKRDELNNG